MTSQEMFKQLELERIAVTMSLHRADNVPIYGSTEMHSRQQLQQKLARIEAALERLANDRYGRCQNCNQRIDPERLEILPYAELCIGCQRQLERQLIVPSLIHTTNR